jgi:Ca-activated chloride channel family protein
MRFESPWALLALLAVVWLIYARRGEHGAVLFSSTQLASKAGRSLRQRFIWLPFLLQILALTTVAVALARPQQGLKRVRNLRRGVAIEMLMDISSSMDISMASRGDDASRLEVAKKAFEAFVRGDGKDLSGRVDDLIGLITFARYADTICPLTSAHDALSAFVDDLRIEDRENEDGTAIGDALALAAARLQTAEEALRRQTVVDEEDYEIKSKVIILLTDGENNCGERLPREGAALAKKWDVRIHAIGFGDPPGTRTVETPDGPREILAALGADTETLARVAETTGGVFRMAHDGESLRAVYEEIDRMETSEIVTLSDFDYRERFTPFALAALAFLFLEALLSSTWLRKIP